MDLLTIQEIQALLPKEKQWSKALREVVETSLLMLNHSNELYYPLFNDKSRFLVLNGGGGSGKSVFACHKTIHRCRTEPHHKWLACRKVGNDLRDSVFTELKAAIETLGYEDKFFIPKGRSCELYLRSEETGNEILFYGLDDVSKRKSIQGVTDILIEEAAELEVEDFRQLNIRMRHPSPTYNQMLLMFNPVSSTSWLKTEFFDKAV